MTHDPPAHAPVVVLVVDGLTAARIDDLLRDDHLVVVIFVVFPSTSRPQGACLAVKLPFAFTPPPLSHEVALRTV